MHRSPAFKKLTKKSVDILLEFMARRKMTELPVNGGRKKEWHIINNGELIFTYDDAVKIFKMARSTFRNCIDKLVKFGFIDIAHQGGGMMKDCSKYSISDRWMDYGKEEFKKKSRQKDTRKLGFQSGDKWEKQTGRKRKSQSKISITDDTRSSITNDTHDQQMAVTPSIVHTTHNLVLNYHYLNDLAVLEAMQPTQYY
jgi:hypothetical protein